jgi:hypothetical protein
MPKELASDLDRRVHAEVSRHSEGISAGMLARRFKNEVSRRSLARIIYRLLLQKSIVVEGKGRSTRYRALPNEPGAFIANEGTATAQAAGEVYVALSPEGEMVRNWVRAPITQRKPVGYDRAFLDAMRPMKPSTSPIENAATGYIASALRYLPSAQQGPTHATS